MNVPPHEGRGLDFSQLTNYDELMIPPLYKYLSVTSAKAVLENRTLRWSTPRTLNDPFDMQTGVQLNLSDEEVVDLALGKILFRLQNDVDAFNQLGVAINILRASGIVLSRQKVAAEFADILRQSIGNFRNRLPVFNAEVIAGLANCKILCLSSACDEHLMWGHYAEGQKGIVLEFGVPLGTDSPLKLAKLVNYLNESPSLLTKEQMADFLSGGLQLDVRGALDLFVYAKKSNWAYEKEWRINAAEGRDRDAPFEDVLFYPEELISVSFGCRTTAADTDLFKNLAQKINPKVKFFQAQRVGLALNFLEL